MSRRKSLELTTHNSNYKNRYIYKFDKELNLFTRTTNTKWDTALLCFLLEILTGRCDIIKIPQPTAEEKLAIDYARACGFKWLAKDKNKTLAAYKEKPQKGTNEWLNTTNDCYDWIEIYLPISFISWEDEEPFYIGVE